MLSRACLTTLSLLCSLPALAQTAPAPGATPANPADVVTPSPWSGSGGELGFASAHGNSSTESFNAKLRGRYTDGDWIHSLDFTGLRSSATYTRTLDDGGVQHYQQTTANRYSGTAGSALQLGEHRQLTATLRYDRDDFASYDRVGTFGLGYGTRLIDRPKFSFDAQIGPGVRRAHDAVKDEEETGLIGRGLFDMHYSITANTDLVNTLLVESGSYNTFAQNDLGVSVSMNNHFALKAAWQMRHNSQVSDDSKKTDTLTTVNLVYTFK
jgi:putative salt-induced outer membrane protein